MGKSDALSQARALAVEQNRKKVQRRKEEAAIMRGLSQNIQLSIDDLRKQHEQEKEARSLSIQQQQQQQQQIQHESGTATGRTSEQKETSVERPPPVQCVASFEAEVTCMETTHGGATIWTGHEDGTIAIRNGVSGEAAYIIEAPPPPQEEETTQEGDANGAAAEKKEPQKPAAVTAMLGTESHMWIGFSDGTIRIYDPLVYILAFESRMHSGPIACFSVTFDSKMFSAGKDGKIIKWDSELSNFEVLAIKEVSCEVSCMTTYGYQAFYGVGVKPAQEENKQTAPATAEGNSDSNGAPAEGSESKPQVAADDSNSKNKEALVSTQEKEEKFALHQFDTETCADIQSYYGHTDNVNSIIVAEGFLISASDDCSVIIWSIDTAQRFHTVSDHQAPVRSLLADPVSHRVWSTDTSGVVNIWELSPAREFPLVSSFQTEENVAVHYIKGAIAVDAIKVWSLGSDGVNRVWHSQVNKIETQTGIAVESMQGIIAEDAIELAKWNELIRTMKAVVERLKRSIATTLTSVTERGTQQQYFLMWLRFLHTRYMIKKRTVAVKALAADCDARLRQVYWIKWSRFLANQKAQRHKETMANVLYQSERRQLGLATFMKLRQFYFFVRRRQKRELVLKQLEARTTTANAASAWNSWRNCVAARAQSKKKAAMAKCLEAVTLENFQREYFLRWGRALQGKKRGNKTAKCSNSLCIRLENDLRGRYFMAWLIKARAARPTTTKRHALLVLARHADKNLLASYYGLWSRFAALKREAKMLAEYEQGKSRIAELLESMRGIEGLVRRQKLLEDAQRAIDKAKQDREAKLARLAEVRAECDGIKEQIEEKRAGAREKTQKSIAEQVEDLIAKLKVKVLNFHQDFPLIHKTQERIKLDKGGVIKVFLEGHIAVKKIVVEITKQTYLGAEDEWPLTEDMVKKLKPHYCEPVLNAIKTMVIAFDTMTPADRQSMTTDGEIVLNAKWLILFADVCVGIRLKKFGKAGAFRVKN